MSFCVKIMKSNEENYKYTLGFDIQALLNNLLVMPTGCIVVMCIWSLLHWYWNLVACSHYPNKNMFLKSVGAILGTPRTVYLITSCNINSSTKVWKLFSENNLSIIENLLHSITYQCKFPILFFTVRPKW